jgi:hypothetical protein
MLQPDELADLVVFAVDQALAPVLARLAVLETKTIDAGATSETIAAVRERIAVLETRPPVPGPPGAAGADGLLLGLEELVVEADGDRGIVIAAVHGAERKAIGRLEFPIPLDAGVYAAGRAYVKGDGVTHNGSFWICQAATTAKPDTAEGAGVWRLAVKRGRDGR